MRLPPYSPVQSMRGTMGYRYELCKRDDCVRCMWYNIFA